MNFPRQSHREQNSSAAIITTLAPADARILASLHRQIFPKPWQTVSFQRLLSVSGTVCLGATTPGDGALAGFAIIRRAADEAEILTLGVTPTYRRRGVGRALVNAISASVSATGCIRIFLEVGADNPAARTLYEAMGYRRTGRRAGYYRRGGSPAIDAIILSCDLAKTGADSN